MWVLADGYRGIVGNDGTVKVVDTETGKITMEIDNKDDIGYLFTEFKGALTENFIFQSLVRKMEVVPRYWSNTTYEVDFVIQKENNIIPVEVKAGTNVRSTSIKKYQEEYRESTPLVIIFSLKNLSLDGNVLNVPLFMVDELDRLIDIAMSNFN